MKKMMLIALAGLTVAFAALLFTGCGDNDPRCNDTPEGCVDAGDDQPADDDMDPTMGPDAGNPAVDEGNPCASYRWMVDQGEALWRCPGFGGESDCVLELIAVDGACTARCEGRWWIAISEMAISRDPPPATLTFRIDGSPVTCSQHP